jgi:hypothetical protein
MNGQNVTFEEMYFKSLVVYFNTKKKNKTKLSNNSPQTSTSNWLKFNQYLRKGEEAGKESEMGSDKGSHLAYLCHIRVTCP